MKCINLYALLHTNCIQMHSVYKNYVCIIGKMAVLKRWLAGGTEN